MAYVKFKHCKSCALPLDPRNTNHEGNEKISPPYRSTNACNDISVNCCHKHAADCNSMNNSHSFKIRLQRVGLVVENGNAVLTLIDRLRFAALSDGKKNCIDQ